MSQPIRRLAAIFCFIALSFPILSLAQYGNNHAILLKSGTIIPAENLEAFIANPTYKQAEVFEGKIYKLIQFHSLPDNETKARMKAAGIELIEFLPRNTFSVALDQNMDWNKLRDFDIRSIITFEPKYKLSPVLLGPNLPDHAKQGDKVFLNLVISKNLSAEKIISVLQSDAIEITHEHKSSNVITVSVDASQYASFAYLPYISYVEAIDPVGEPENYTGRTLHRSNVINTDYAGGLKYDGSGIIVGMGDDGPIGPHIDYTGREDQSYMSGTGSGNHGDHVAGIIFGAGNKNPKHRGMATGADLWAMDPFEPVNKANTLYNNPGIPITSTSYSNGCNAGYTSFAMSADQDTRNMPSLVHVFSAGNQGSGTDCGYGAGAGWGNVTGGVKVGKNVIAVGSLTQTGGLSGFSSRGPAKDGRIKPDVCAKGSSVTSTLDPNTYGAKSGTSMACPGVSGVFAQLYQAYMDIESSGWPESGLIKGIVMNTADDLGNPGPDFKYGYGEINAGRVVQTLQDGRYLEDSITNGQTKNFNISVPSGTAEIRVMLYWTDYEGAANSAPALVNDLNLTVTDVNQITWKPWVLDPTPNATNLNANALQKVDTLNNMEQFTRSGPPPGTYTINVEGLAVPQGPQKFWLTWEFRDSAVHLTYPIGGEPLVPGETERIRWDAAGFGGNFKVEYSLDSGSNWTSINNNVGVTTRHLNWTVPNTVTGQALVRITRAGFVDMSDTTFSIIDVPANLSTGMVCPLGVELSWDSVPGAIGYEVSMLGAKYMDSVATTTNTSAIVGPVNGNAANWWSVKALGPDGCIGRRAIAVFQSAGVSNCNLPQDAEIQSIDNPTGTLSDCGTNALDSVQVQITILNAGTDTLWNVPVHYILNSMPAITDTAPGPIAPGATGQFTFGQTINVSTPATHMLTSWSSVNGDWQPNNDSTITQFTVISGTVYTIPHFQDFEADTNCGVANDCEQTICGLTNGWINITNQSGDDIDWRVDDGGTGSGNTGPGQDFNPGTAQGNYVYTEASSGCTGKEAILLSPCIDLSNTNQPVLIHARHMWGADMGDLHVDLFEGGSWTNDIITPISGNQGNAWYQDTISLMTWKNKIINVRWRGITGTDYTSDIALDDIQFTDLAPNPVAAFGVNTNSPCVGETVSLLDSSMFTPTSWTWTITPGTVTYVGGTDSSSQDPLVTFNVAGTYTVKLVVVNANGTDSLTQVSYINANTGFSLPIAEDFESFNLCATTTNCGATVCPLGNGWTNEVNLQVDDIDFRVHEDSTASNNTGPSIDFNPGMPGGNYIYLEASNGCTAKTAMITSSCIDLSGTTYPQMTLAYHMYGANMGSLHFDVLLNGTWTNDFAPAISGNQGNQWNQLTIPLTPYIGQTIKLRIRGITGSDYDSDLALDDIVVENLLPPVAGFSAPNICIGDTTTITDASGGSPTSWLWAFGAGASPAMDTTQGPHQVTWPTDGQKTVTLIVGNAAGFDTIMQTVNVDTFVTPTASIQLTSGQNPACAGDSLTFTASGTHQGTAPTYDWFVNGVPAQSSSLATFTSTTLNDGDTVMVTITSSEMCVTSATANSGDTVIALISDPVAAFAQSTLGDSVFFTDQSTGTVDTWSWDFGDSSGTSNVQNPAYPYSTPGTYTVTLIASNACGNDTTTQTVVVVGRPGLISHSIKVFPNPSNGQIQVTVSGARSEIEWNVIDVIGKQLRSGTERNTKFELNLNDLAAGTYYLRVRVEGQQLVEKLVIE